MICGPLPKLTTRGLTKDNEADPKADEIVAYVGENMMVSVILIDLCHNRGRYNPVSDTNYKLRMSTSGGFSKIEPFFKVFNDFF